MESVECAGVSVECKVWEIKCKVWSSVKFKVWSVKPGVESVKLKCAVWS